MKEYPYPSFLVVCDPFGHRALFSIQRRYSNDVREDLTPQKLFGTGKERGEKFATLVTRFHKNSFVALVIIKLCIGLENQTSFGVSDNTNLERYVHGAATMLYSEMSCLRNPDNPRRVRNSYTVLGLGILLTTSNFDGDMRMQMQSIIVPRGS